MLLFLKFKKKWVGDQIKWLQQPTGWAVLFPSSCCSATDATERLDTRRAEIATLKKKRKGKLIFAYDERLSLLFIYHFFSLSQEQLVITLRYLLRGNNSLRSCLMHMNSFIQDHSSHPALTCQRISWTSRILHALPLQLLPWRFWVFVCPNVSKGLPWFHVRWL